MVELLQRKIGARQTPESAEIVGLHMAEPISRLDAMKAAHRRNVIEGLAILDCPATRNLRSELGLDV